MRDVRSSSNRIRNPRFDAFSGHSNFEETSVVIATGKSQRNSTVQKPSHYEYDKDWFDKIKVGTGTKRKKRESKREVKNNKKHHVQ